MAHEPKDKNQKLNIAILTVSDTRTEENDTSGKYLVEALKEDGHTLADKAIVIDDKYLLRAKVSAWIADPEIHVIITTGGTGFAGRDSTPEALAPLLEKHIDGFGEMFRSISFEEIGSSTIQSRALAGLANKTLVACLPGSTGACRTGWTKLLKEQLTASHMPCNFVGYLTK
ncbi:molybdenum cofactor biosynthesis protein B [Microbulbifer sp. ALW1]|uniref:molybdenum cofactor biosynthesis protein B n=1 Tax=Microbulbifer sp. (strain ALW1) TaxID=1516059 RepID=UPI0013569D48|nr:molybdenum cofactor biosynthesis protein B [Microbulbifer sp. ALW1]